MVACETCMHKNLPSFSATCVECGIAMKNYQPITNADRIRAMTDEELADEILKWFNWLNAVEWDEDRIINWLKQEAET